MRLALVTGYDASYRPIAEASVPNKKGYAEAYGFDLKVFEQEPIDGRTPHWLKIVWLYQAMPFADWLFWTDADSLIANQKVNLCKWIDRASPETNLIIAEDLPWLTYPPGTIGVNTGNFFLRSCEWSEILLSEIWNDCPARLKVEAYHEQSVLTDLINSRAWVRRHTQIVSMREFNSLSEVYQKGDFSKHFAGLSNRGQQMREFLKSCDAYSLPCASSA